MMHEIVDNTETIIRKAARKIFLEKGLAGSRMQDIADEARINKSMLHYYFRSKEKLFHLIFENELNDLFGNLDEILDSSLPIFEKIQMIIERDINSMTACPQLPIFLLNEMSQCPENFLRCVHRIKAVQRYARFRSEIIIEIEKGTIRAVNPDQLFLNIIALTVYPFIAKPFLLNLFNFTEKDYGRFMDDRKQEITRLVMDNLKPAREKTLQ